MNKKVSTIFAMAALMGGVFSGSAYAFNLPIDVVNTEQSTVVLKQGDNVLAFVKDGNTTKAVVAPATNVAENQVLNYTWTLQKAEKTVVDKKDYYIFKNAVTGDTLSFDANYDLFFSHKMNNKMVYAGDPSHYYMFTFGEDGKAYTKDGEILYAAGSQKALAIYPDDKVVLEDVVTDSETGVVTPNAFVLADLQTKKASVAELNGLYNGYGFNLGIKPVLSNVTVEGNIFGGEDRIWAFEVTADTDGADIGYLLTKEGENGEKLYIPKGIYFFTNPVFKNNATQLTATEDNIDWLASTLVALSPTVTEEGTDADRADGAGFSLVKVQGSDFIYMNNASIPEGDDIDIRNACFSVKDNFASNDSYPFALTVNTFFYQKSAQFKGEDDQAHTTAYLVVSSYDNSRQSLVSTDEGSENYIFNLTASSVIEGKTLLHNTKKAAVYTIKFVSGSSTLNGKYLTVGNIYNDNTGTVSQDFEWEAKGAAIYDETYPIFQFTITDVDGTNVEFTNRETGASFTTQLFKEDGENRYSLSVSETDLTTSGMEVQAYTVDTKGANTYEVSKLGTDEVDASLVVELKRLDEVDEYAGFLGNVDKEIRTLAFARDVNDTSNKLYALVADDALVDDADGFTNDIYSAAQWQLVQGKKNTISRVYVYNNTSTNSIDDVPEGDKVSAYTYQLQYITDGTESGLYLPANHSMSLVGKNVASFIIKENVDGSVSLINASSTFTNKKVTGATTTKAIEMNEDRDGYDNSDAVYTSESIATEIKTYLDARPVEISWPAKEGHVTLMSELGNYVNMNENRDAIVVAESDGDAYYLYVTDKNAIVPSFYITKGIAAENGERMFMFNPTDSVSYYVADGEYDRQYEWAEDRTKVLFKAASINETRDTLAMTVKGETKYIAKEADDDNKDIWGGLNRFKFQIIEAEDAEGYYRIRQNNSDNGLKDNEGDVISGMEWNYLSALNDKLTWSNKGEALLFEIESVAAPTANEGVSATEVKIIATDGAVNVKNAAGKNVVISTILGQIVANEVLTSDNATISVPAGIAIVSVDGEEAVKVSVR